MCAPCAENAVREGEHVVIIRRDGTKHVGGLLAFNNEIGSIQLLEQDSQQPLQIDLATVKIVNLPDLRQWIRAEPPEGSNREALLLSDTKQPFRSHAKFNHLQHEDLCSMQPRAAKRQIWQKTMAATAEVQRVHC